ncbi:extracellular solute-binding protein [Paenibacillus whitsoniae]|uniref:Extracellular solute-binding protein n=1 Tax=Paenibacillus whitsoniae TaxID=2496558 RepID=A0A3S0A6L7_9BACL|nr:extracellular solute-binding protein [Paenibacillus whitsoniae]RTE10821.1 extracellular solute-binding protein [Paenibacillus whitsoniae]
MKRFTRGTCLAIVLGMTLFLSACRENAISPNRGSSLPGTPSMAAEIPDPVKLKVMLFGERPMDMDRILQKFDQMTHDTLNTALQFEFSPYMENEQKMMLRMSTGEPVDLMFDAPWTKHLFNNVSMGYYQQLDKYFNNDHYPGLKKAFPKEMLDSNKINGHIYTIPLFDAYYDPPVIAIRKDIRESLGMKPLETMDDLTAFYDKVLQQYPDDIPATIGSRGIFRLGLPDAKGHNDIRLAPMMSDSFTGGIPFSVALSKDGKKVIDAATIGDPDSEFADFPAPFNSHDAIYGHFGTRVQFRKYNNLNPLSSEAEIALDIRKAASQADTTLSGIARLRQDLQRVDAHADYEPFLLGSQAQRDMQSASIGTTFWANNSLVIPVTSKNTDRTMKFLDWLFSRQENHDLFELGIEGEHWVKDGEAGYKLTADSPNYRFPGYELTNHSTMSRILTDNDPKTLAYMKWARDNGSYYQLPLSGFIFNSASVATEIAKVKPLMLQASDLLMTGMVKEWKDYAREQNKKWRALGLDTIRQEVVRQVQAYLDAGGK